MVQKFDIIVVGAGLVGLAAAYQLRQRFPEAKLAVLEKELGPAKHQSGHNSGVVHTGVYYKPGSLKAQNCVAGREELFRFCEEYGIRVQKIHKVIVATRPEELPQLQEIFRRGNANGVPDLEQIGSERLQEIEPHAQGLQAIYVPHSAVIHFPDVAQVLVEWLERRDCPVLFGEKVVAIREDEIITSKNVYAAKRWISCTGLHSDRLAKQMEQRIIPFRGEYYLVKAERADLVKGLIYPVPDPKFPFLGVHLTRMVDGAVEAGPNAVLAWAREGYRKTDFRWKDAAEMMRYPGFWRMGLRYWNVGLYEMYRSFSKKAFVRDLQRLVPAIREEDLVPGGSGVRAQLVTREGKLADDFAIVQEGNAIHVLNAPSPAATACFAIGRQIAGLCSD